MCCGKLFGARFQPLYVQSGKFCGETLERVVMKCILGNHLLPRLRGTHEVVLPLDARFLAGDCLLDLMRHGRRHEVWESSEFRARRKPLLFVRFVGSFALRFAVRQFAASLFQLPPRFTWFEPLRIVHHQLS